MEKLLKKTWVRLLASLFFGLLLAWPCMMLTARLSAVYWSHKYPHDGQIGLGVLFVALTTYPVFAVGLCFAIFVLLPKWKK